MDDVTQGFAEEAELEALQIDKNDLKLVFGRPFARGKTSEVYQVTHAGKNRAAKVNGELRRAIESLSAIDERKIGGGEAYSYSRVFFACRRCCTIECASWRTKQLFSCWRGC